MNRQVTDACNNEVHIAESAWPLLDLQLSVLAGKGAGDDIGQIGGTENKLGSRRLLDRHNAPRACRSGVLDNIISPVNGRPSSKIRKIAEAAEKASSER